MGTRLCLRMCVHVRVGRASKCFPRDSLEEKKESPSVRFLSKLNDLMGSAEIIE